MGNATFFSTLNSSVPFLSFIESCGLVYNTKIYRNSNDSFLNWEIQYFKYSSNSFIQNENLDKKLSGQNYQFRPQYSRSQYKNNFSQKLSSSEQIHGKIIWFTDEKSLHSWSPANKWLNESNSCNFILDRLCLKWID